MNVYFETDSSSEVEYFQPTPPKRVRLFESKTTNKDKDSGKAKRVTKGAFKPKMATQTRAEQKKEDGSGQPDTDAPGGSDHPTSQPCASSSSAAPAPGGSDHPTSQPCASSSSAAPDQQEEPEEPPEEYEELEGLLEEVIIEERKNNVYMHTKTRVERFQQYDKFLDFPFWNLNIDEDKFESTWARAKTCFERNLFHPLIREMGRNFDFENSSMTFRFFFKCDRTEMQDQELCQATYLAVGTNIQTMLNIKHQKYCTSGMMHVYYRGDIKMSIPLTTEDCCNFCPQEKNDVYHVLNQCKEFLKQGRYSWRHDAILEYLTTVVDCKKYTVFADLPGRRTPDDGTIPQNLMHTLLRPDLVVLGRKDIYIFELTVPRHNRIKISHEIKVEKYDSMIQLLQQKNPQYKVHFEALEIASLGHISARNSDILEKFLKLARRSYLETAGLLNLKSSLTYISRITSAYIYMTKDERHWEAPQYPPRMFYVPNLALNI
jgi:hypothetical protein